MFFEDAYRSTGELHGQAARCGAGLAATGVQPGDRVVIVMANCPEVSVSYEAVWRAGAVVTPAMFLLPPDELRRLIDDSEATAVITTAEFTANVAAATEGLTNIKALISTGAEVPESFISFDEIGSAPEGPMVKTDEDDLACILYTGGTTGRSKGVMISHRNLAFGAKAAFDAADAITGDRALAVLPLAHGYGMLNFVASQFNTNGHAVLMRWFEPNMWLQLVQDHKIRRSAMVPTMLQMLLSCPIENYDLSSLEIINSGAAPLALETVKMLEAKIPSLKILEGYGLSESGIVGCLNRRDARKLGTVGQPLEGYAVKAVDDDGVEVAANEPGEICIKSVGVMQGYWKSPEATDAALKDGWLYTGDIGTVDEDGFVRIVDRKKDLIIRGGFNVFPRDVEDALLEDPSIEMAGVVGRPDDKYGEEVVAFVSLRPGAETTPHDIIEASKTRLGAHKYPREVKIVGYLPITPIGKVDRKALRALL